MLCRDFEITSWPAEKGGRVPGLKLINFSGSLTEANKADHVQNCIRFCQEGTVSRNMNGKGIRNEFDFSLCLPLE